MGFAVHVGVETHSSNGLNENIFHHLETAEYVVFIDFPQDGAGFHRSIFSHQEIAIASYMKADLLPFLPGGGTREGMLKFMQGNPIPYTNPDELPELVVSNVKREGWDNRHRRELRVEVSPDPPGHATIPQGFTRQIPAGEYRYFELALKNLHRRLMATDCLVQIVGCRGPSYDDGQSRDIIEMKFKHMVNPSIVLPPGQRRQFDGVVVRASGAPDPYMPLACPGILNPGHIDSESIVRQYLMREPGDYELDLEVHSHEFGTQDVKVQFHFDRDPYKCSLSVVKPSVPSGSKESTKPGPDNPPSSSVLTQPIRILESGITPGSSAGSTIIVESSRYVPPETK
jgi:hypothetical protein